MAEFTKRLIRITGTDLSTALKYSQLKYETSAIAETFRVTSEDFYTLNDTDQIYIVHGCITKVICNKALNVYGTKITNCIIIPNSKKCIDEIRKKRCTFLCNAEITNLMCEKVSVVIFYTNSILQINRRILFIRSEINRIQLVVYGLEEYIDIEFMEIDTLITDCITGTVKGTSKFIKLLPMTSFNSPDFMSSIYFSILYINGKKIANKLLYIYIAK